MIKIMPTFTQLGRKGRKQRRYKNKRLDLRGCPQRQGLCKRAFKMTPRKPNSALRKVGFFSIRKWKWELLVFIPGDRGKDQKHPLQNFSRVLIRGGRAKDLPGVKYTAICGHYDLPRLWSRLKGRSKFGGLLTRHKVDCRYKKFYYN